MADAAFNCVAILDSIPSAELQISKRLAEDLEDLRFANSNTPGIRYTRVESRDDLFRELDLLADAARDSGLRPLIHMECHGSRSGIQLAGCETATWKELGEGLSRVNVETRLNLMAVFAVCHATYLTESFDLSGPAPVWGLIAPRGEISTGRVEADFGAMYRTLFRTLDPSAALQALNTKEGKPSYARITAETLFLMAWRSYKREFCTPMKLEQRARAMRKKLIAEQGSRSIGLGKLRRLLKREEKPGFERMRDLYFMCDIYPDHRRRFAVTYKAAERFANENPSTKRSKRQRPFRRR
ncbi:MAG: hypothetical protein RIB46_01275 [Pseudomonadales bacterium]